MLGVTVCSCVLLAIDRTIVFICTCSGLGSPTCIRCQTAMRDDDAAVSEERRTLMGREGSPSVSGGVVACLTGRVTDAGFCYVSPRASHCPGVKRLVVVISGGRVRLQSDGGGRCEGGHASSARLPLATAWKHPRRPSAWRKRGALSRCIAGCATRRDETRSDRGDGRGVQLAGAAG